MSFSPFDKRLLEEGLGYFSRPRLASLLEQLGSSRLERVDALATMLRHCPDEEFDEAIDIFERAMARAARDRVQAQDADRKATRTDQPRRRSAAAERREQRRRSS